MLQKGLAATEWLRRKYPDMVATFGWSLWVADRVQCTLLLRGARRYPKEFHGASVQEAAIWAAIGEAELDGWVYSPVMETVDACNT